MQVHVAYIPAWRKLFSKKLPCESLSKVVIKYPAVKFHEVDRKKEQQLGLQFDNFENFICSLIFLVCSSCISAKMKREKPSKRSSYLTLFVSSM